MESLGALESTLLERLREQRGIDPHLRGTVALDVDEGAGWTVSIRNGRLALLAGLDHRPDTTIAADATTMAAVLGGSISGIHAFLDGRLRVRGNLALSLRLNGWFEEGSRPARFPRAEQISAGGLSTFLLRAGDGPPVVLLHGLGATNASFLTTLWDLARDHRVFAPDLPGFGDTAKPITSYDSSFFTRWLLSLLDELGVERAHLVGNSLGGRIGIETALRAPERVDRIALLAPSPAFIRRREFVRIVSMLRPEMALLPVPLPRRRVLDALRALFARPERLSDAWYESAADEFLRVFSTARGRIAFFSSARQIYLEEPYGNDGFWDRLPDLSRPALFVWGERDRIVPAKFARHVEKALPAATSVVVEDCGHVPQYELPERTHELVREFID